MTMCKSPELACEITMGPIEEFGFDAAILFSDLLFPLEQLNMGLNYLQGPPRLAFHLETLADLDKLKVIKDSQSFYQFQKSALELLKQRLPQNKTLIGFVGAPFTLYTYAVEGSHAGQLVSAKNGLYDGRFRGFIEKLYPVLLENMKIQAQGGADAMSLFDTAAGELSPIDYQEHIAPLVTKLINEFKEAYPDKKIIYYSKHTNEHHLKCLSQAKIDVYGVDWRCDISEMIKHLPKDSYIQGNYDPTWLHLPEEILLGKLKKWQNSLKEKNFPFERWIAGLGHGVLVKTPEKNVKESVKLIQKSFEY